MISLSKGLYVFDLEADSLLEGATKIHCLSIGKILKNGDIKIVTTDDYDVMRDFFLRKDITKIGHNIIRYDSCIVEKILGVSIPEDTMIDTLPLSWVFFHYFNEHGLEAWGQRLGVAKPEVTDWKNQPLEVYTQRCEEDVKINFLLWKEQKEKILQIYRLEEEALRFIWYSNFKSICVKEQEKIGVRFDIDKCKSVIQKLESEVDPKLKSLESVMPKVPKYSKKKKPSSDKMYNKNGSMSASWQSWLQFCVDYGVPENWDEDYVEYESGQEDPSAGSPKQLKDWLYSLGWVPQTFNKIRNKNTGEEKKIPQIYTEDKDVCPSIVLMYDKVPELELLDSLGVLKHRKSLLEGFMKSYKEVDEGNYRLYGSISGYTNTMRLIHKKPLVNLPKVTKPYGDDIRGCLIADEGKVLVGSDLSGIESVTRNHYIFPYDKSYIQELDNPMYDPHIKIGVLANFFTEEEGQLYIDVDKGVIEHPTDEQLAIIKKIKPLRSKAKNTNFGATYGQGAKALSEKTGMSLKEAKYLIQVYWELNWAIKEFANSCEVKEVDGGMWIKNPVSRFWYSLRSDKDRFATVNSSTAVYIFDLWVKYTRSFGAKIQYQCHDEHLFSVKKGKEDLCREMLIEAIRLVNEELELNVTVSMNPAFGSSYASVH